MPHSKTLDFPVSSTGPLWYPPRTGTLSFIHLIMTNEKTLQATSDANPYGPLTPSGLLQRTFVMYRERPSLVFGLMLIVAAVQLVATGAITSSSDLLQRRAGMGMPPLQIALFVIVCLLASLLTYLVMQVVQGAFFYAVTAWVEGRTMPVGDACSLALERIGRLIGVSLQVAIRVFGYSVLLGLILSGVGVAVGVLLQNMIGESLHASGWMGYALILVPVVAVLLGACVLAIFWIIARYAISIPACLAENMPASDAVRRSIALSAKSRSRIYAMYALVMVFVVVSAMIVLPLRLLAMYPGRHLAMFPLLNAVASAVNLLFGTWAISFTGIATTLCYYDLRARKEGLGVTILSQTDAADAPQDETLPSDLPHAEPLVGS